MDGDNHMNVLKNCTLCPRMCHVNRYQKVGYCKAGSKIKLALVSLHHFEEPFISGKMGSGTIFFSHCNLGCIYCQNKEVRDGYGKEVTIKRLSDILIEQQERGAHNINLVTPTHYVPLIKKAILKAKRNGLFLPVIYNTSSYESVDTIKMMDGLVDIYLADFKYSKNSKQEIYSNCQNYFSYASRAIEEMYQQVGRCKIEKGLLKKGLVVRILLLPKGVEECKQIVKYLYDKYQDFIYISIMNQYTRLDEYMYQELNQDISEREYDELVEYACSLGIKNAWIQEGKTQDKSFIPNFNCDRV